MGSGKSTVGARLASALGWPFVDLDRWIAARFGPIPEQVARDGWEVFRARERALAASVSDHAPRVLATGGGTWIDAAAREAIAGAYRTVWLDVPLATSAARVGGGEGRPLWDAGVARRYEARGPVYALADLRVDGDRPVGELVAQILAWMEAP